MIRRTLLILMFCPSLLILVPGCASKGREEREVVRKRQEETEQASANEATTLSRTASQSITGAQVTPGPNPGDAERARDFTYATQRTRCDRSDTQITDDYKNVARFAEHLFLGSSPLSDAEETRYGDRFWEAMSKEMAKDLDHDAALTGYVRTMGERLATRGERQNIDYRFHVLHKDELNAFAMPGGRIVIYTGLLQKLENEAQLAMVLAHEIGHVERRHGNETLQFAKQILGDVNDISLLLSTFLRLPTSTKHEEEADAFALSLLLKEGMSPFQGIRLFEEIMPGKGTLTEQIALEIKTGDPDFDKAIRETVENPLFKELENLLSTHPSGKQRACRLKQQAYDELKEQPDRWFQRGTRSYQAAMSQRQP